MSSPERIWANVIVYANGRAMCGEWHYQDAGNADDTEYVRADLAQPQWQTIETAPRDGTTIVAMRDESGRRGVTIIFWDAYEAEWCGTTAENERMLVKFAPTHWMPLPAPPADP